MPYNSTIIVKKKQLGCGCYDYNFSKNRCVNCTKQDNFGKQMEKELAKEIGLPKLINDADAIFSVYIRLKYANSKGLVKCYTCDVMLPYQQMQNGHYVSRKCLYLRYDERNCRPQDEICNCHKHGNLTEFGKRLEQKNDGITEILYQEKQIVYKPTRDEIIQLISEYTKKVSELKKKLNL